MVLRPVNAYLLASAFRKWEQRHLIREEVTAAEAFSYNQNHIVTHFYIGKLSEGRYCTVTRSVGFCGSFAARY